jgi:hypothetical protein
MERIFASALQDVFFADFNPVSIQTVLQNEGSEWILMGAQERQ